MKRAKQSRRTGVLRWLGKAKIPLLTLGVLLILARLALPYVMRAYVNRQLKQVQEYSGSVGGIRMNLYRGAYKIYNLQLVKTNANLHEPFISLPEMDLSVEWKALFRGAIAGQITVNHPRVNFVNGPSDQQQQTGLHKSWKQTLESLFPFTINRFQVNDGLIRYADPYRNPPVDISISNLFATATNLTNVRKKDLKLPAGLVARGITTGHGALSLELLMNPLADSPTFKVLASVTNLDLTALNDFMRAYGNFDVQNGTFALYLDVAAARGQYQGYIKPFFFDLNIFSWPDVTHENILRTFWEAIVAGVSELLRNQPYNQLATTIPISGQLQNGANLDLWATIGGILQNAFVRALLPKLNHPVPLPGGGPNRGPPAPR